MQKLRRLGGVSERFCEQEPPAEILSEAKDLRIADFRMQK